MATEKIKIWVQVHPNARGNEVQGEKDGIWQLKVAAPPVRGRANQELVKFLSDVLQISRSNLEIEQGLSGRRKLMAISGLSLEQVKARFSNAVGQRRLN
ncbi:MAG: DUF167 domain-containing protein [Dehalococcoidia bacterium]|nr:DUF167 domain-containing protein [Dehalococcoidia bacterium]